MMLSRVGPPPHRQPRLQVSGGRQAPWGWGAGAPYRGTASPPPPPPPPVCLCVSDACMFAVSVYSGCLLGQTGHQIHQH